jgi:hypothetical protein
MLLRLSHPLAFATAPLDGTAPEYGGESFFVVGDEGFNAPGMGDTLVPITRSMAGTMLQGLPPPLPLPDGIVIVRDVGRTVGCVNGSVGEDDMTAVGDGRDVREGGKTLEEYAVENHQLKIAVDQLSRKVASYKEVCPPCFSPTYPIPLLHHLAPISVH